MVESTFMYLTLDLPTAPLYKDEKEQLIIPQVPLFNILAKFNGIMEKVTPLLCPLLDELQAPRAPPWDGAPPGPAFLARQPQLA